MVVHEGRLAGLYAGTPEAAWSQAADLSDQLHIVYKDHPFHTVLSCAPPMYDEIWVGGKCMYKLEPVVADGGELIIYAPHIREISRDARRDHPSASATTRAIISWASGSASRTSRGASWRIRRTSAASAPMRTASRSRASR